MDLSVPRHFLDRRSVDSRKPETPPRNFSWARLAVFLSFRVSLSPFSVSRQVDVYYPGQERSPAREEGGARAFWRGQLTFSLANPVQAASTAAYKVLKHWREHRRSPTGPAGVATDKYIITSVPRISLIIWWRHGTHGRLETREW